MELTVLALIQDLHSEEDSFKSFPCIAAHTIYQPPPAASLTGIIGEVKSQSTMSGSSVLRKSYTSDDELDELDSPISSIVIDNFRVSPTSAKPNLMLKKDGDRKVVRYQLLREVWRDGEQPCFFPSLIRRCLQIYIVLRLCYQNRQSSGLRLLYILIS